MLAAVEPDYQPFPNDGRRNWCQEHLELPLMIMALNLPRGGRVLEVGCGRGVALPSLDRLLMPSRLVGLDIDGSLLAEARTRLGDTSTPAELIAGDVRRLPFSDGAFDLVIDFGTCYHIARPQDAFAEIARVLVPSGTFATETRMSQLLAHPVRARNRSVNWATVPVMPLHNRCFLWQSRQRNRT